MRRPLLRLLYFIAEQFNRPDTDRFFEELTAEQLWHWAAYFELKNKGKLDHQTGEGMVTMLKSIGRTLGNAG